MKKILLVSVLIGLAAGGLVSMMPPSGDRIPDPSKPLFTQHSGAVMCMTQQQFDDADNLILHNLASTVGDLPAGCTVADGDIPVTLLATSGMVMPDWRIAIKFTPTASPAVKWTGMGYIRN